MKRLLFLLFLIPQTLLATTRGVSPGGADSGNCAFVDCRTLVYSIGQMAGGDTLFIGDGTYPEQLHNIIPAGSAGAPTIIKALHNRQAVIKPTSVVSGGFGVVDVVQKDYITFDGIVEDGGVVNFENNDGFRIDDSNHIIIQNSEIRFNNKVNTMIPANCASAPNGVEVTTTSGHHGSRFDLFTHNYVHDNGAFCADGEYEGLGYYIQESDVTIDGDTLLRNAEADIQLRNGSGDPAAGRNIVVRNSSMTASPRTGIFIANYIVGAKIYSNTIAGVAGGYGATFYSNSATTLFANNTIFGGAAGCIHLDNGSGASPTNNTIENNICYMNSGVAIVDTGTGTSCSSNLNVVGCGPTEGATDPKFVNQAGGDFHLLAGSPAAGIGANLCSIFCTDLDGTPRTVPWSAGAFVATVPPSKYRGFFALF